MANGSVSRTSGIYIIANKKSGKVYIGQSQDIHKRWDTHKSMLIGEKHYNPHLQSAWNKDGAKSFKFQVLEYCAVDCLDEREQHYLDTYISKGICYNLAIDVTAPMRGRKASEETKEKIRQVRLGTNLSTETRKKLSDIGADRKQTPETCAKISLSNKGRPRSPEAQAKTVETRRLGDNYIVSEETRLKKRDSMLGQKRTPETRAKMRIAQKGSRPSPEALEKSIDLLSKCYIIISPEWVETRIKNLNKFCRENNLHAGHMISVAKGRTRDHKGWRCKYDEGIE